MSSDVNPAKEKYQPWDPQKSANRRAGWEDSLNTGCRVDEPKRWNGVDH